ncbi:MAG: DUF1853 family protein [Halioglobus sp.]
MRDLAWACFGPRMMHTRSLNSGELSIENCALDLTDARRDWLNKLDQNPTALHEWLERSPTRRLGLYFEALWQYFLETDPMVDLVAHNLAVRANGRTLGEFDCLYFCHERKRHVHLELAVKYFLGIDGETISEQSQWQQWWGPNTVDRLDLKINHLMNRQIQLGQQPEAKAALADLGIIDPILEVEIRGYLFRKNGSALPSPVGYNSQQPLAKWLFHGDASAFIATSQSARFTTLPRLHWLSAARATDNQCLSGQDMITALDAHFNTSTRPQLLAAMDENGWETERFFIVPDGWPEPEPSSPSS